MKARMGMSTRVACIALFIALVSSTPARGEPLAALRGKTTTKRFAIVIGNNAPESEQGETLQFADDDAVATHALLSEAGVTSTLLVDLDSDTRRMHPHMRPTGPASFASIRAALAQHNSAMALAEAAGHDTELMFFFSGHGDVDGGEGYVVLGDGRLTRSMLHTDILTASGATWNHVVIDACKSYFMVYEKNSGVRSPYHAAFAQHAVPANLANTGFLLSTSSARDSHEWTRYQSGVFSYELRSALRGAADADNNGRLTYAELGAFLRLANAAIENPLFRPDIVVRPPQKSIHARFLDWPTGAKPIAVRTSTGHLYIENGLGIRLVEIHGIKNGSRKIYLPRERPLFAQTANGSAERRIDSDTQEITNVVSRPRSVSRRGALHRAFGKLFATPFGPRHVSQFAARFRSEERARTIWETRPAHRSRVGPIAGWSAVGFTAFGAGLNLYSWRQSRVALQSSQRRRVELNQTIRRLNLASAAIYALGVASAVTWYLAQARNRASLLVAPSMTEAGGASLLFSGRW